MERMETSFASGRHGTGLAAAWRRAWRLPLVILHILAGMLEALWLRARYPQAHPAMAMAKQRWYLRLLSLLGVRLRVTGAPAGGAMLLISNHVSWLDIPVIGALWPCDMLSKAEVAEWPVIGWLARNVGTLFIRRGSGEVSRKVEEIRERLAGGRSVLVFPEGTTTDGRAVRRFFPQLLAAADQAPVQPVALRYRDHDGDFDPALAFIGNDEFHHHLWRLLGRPRVIVDLTFGAPLPADDDPKRLSERAREWISGQL
ncbi:lysophospholipid acyltransferase family protein [Alloalcanivorax xenomutans]|uniref:lysophospholipid acyltransferase family protein n=1 Tax=Alloalcanivorax xenomutans TaxID=1094342 RepID=UPI0024E1B9D7|nr:1-acyl-sn-glycerol-3-phosphate acyltransferase [Alloalcanivorax xenomutans]